MACRLSVWLYPEHSKVGSGRPAGQTMAVAMSVAVRLGLGSRRFVTADSSAVYMLLPSVEVLPTVRPSAKPWLKTLAEAFT